MVQNNVFSNSTSVKVDRWECVYEGFCAMMRHLDLEEKKTCLKQDSNLWFYDTETGSTTRILQSLTHSSALEYIRTIS